MTRLHVVFGLGPVGRSVVRALRARGERVRVVVRSARALDPSVEVCAGDATSPESTRALCAGASHVYQCTNARDYHRWPEQFPPLQRGILAGAAAHGARLVVLENFYVYGAHGGTPMSEDDPLLGVGPRASTRIAMTRELEAAHARGEVSVVRVRAADLVGPHVRQSMAGEGLFEPILRGEKTVRMFSDPDVVHALAYVDDVGEALVRAALDPDAAGHVLHVPCAPAITPRALVSAIAAAAGRPAPRIDAPPRWALPLLLPVVGALVPPFRGIAESTWMFYEPFEVDARRYRRRYGVEPRPMSEAIARTVAWYRDAMATPRAA